jgi:hypothetical protein
MRGRSTGQPGDRAREGIVWRNRASVRASKPVPERWFATSTRSRGEPRPGIGGTAETPCRRSPVSEEAMATSWIRSPAGGDAIGKTSRVRSAQGGDTRHRARPRRESEGPDTDYRRRRRSVQETWQHAARTPETPEGQADPAREQPVAQATGSTRHPLRRMEARTPARRAQRSRGCCSSTRC